MNEVRAWVAPLGAVVLCVLIMTGCLRGVGAPGSTAAAYAFVGVHVVPMDSERLLENQTVIIREGRIVAVGPSHSITIPGDAEQIQGRGRYLMPGLADFHVHLHTEEELLSHLAHGVTTLFDVDGSPRQLALRAELAQGQRLGPTLYTSSPRTDGDPPVFGGAVVVSTLEQSREVARAHRQAGYDAIKVYNNLSPEAYAVLAAEARSLRIPVVGHIPRKVGLEGALRARQAAILHGEEYFVFQQDESKIPELARATRAAGTWVVPNLSRLATTQRMLEDLEGVFSQPEARYLPPQVLRDWRGSNPTRRVDLEAFIARERVKYPFVQRLTRGLHEAGVRLLLGTDASLAGIYPGQSAHQELHELVKAGLTPYQALAIGTREAGAFIAEHVDPAARFGTVALGQRADLVLLEKNPLESVANASQPLGVMVRGRWLSRAELQRLRDAAAAAWR